MPPDPLAELTRLQEQEERAVKIVEEHRRQIATLEALLEDAKRRGEAPGVIEARIEAAEEEVARAGREIAALRSGSRRPRRRCRRTCGTRTEA